MCVIKLSGLSFCFFKAELCVSVFVCKASLSLSTADEHELKILPLETVSTTEDWEVGGHESSCGPVRPFVLCTK